MKKSTIWAIAIIMGFSFLALLYLQFSYVEEMVKMKKEQFDESVNRSLYQASRNLEMNETLRYLEKDVNETERRAFTQDSIYTDGLGGIKQSHQFAVAADDGTVYSSFQLKTFEMKPASVPKAMILRKDKSSLADAAKTMQEIVRNRYVYQRALLDEVVYNILYTASEKPLKERVNFRMLDNDIREQLANNGINIPYHFTVSTTDGREVYRCPDFEEKGKEYTYSQILFRNDPQSKMGIVRIHFPEMNSYIFSSGCTDDERRLDNQVGTDDEASERRDYRRVEASAFPCREGAADVDVRQEEHRVQEEGTRLERDGGEYSPVVQPSCGTYRW